MSYRVEFQEQAEIDLGKLPATWQKRIISKITWLAENFEEIRHIQLSANLAGFYKLRVGDYRVIYEFDRTIRVVTIERIGHRRDVYE
ncbi:MAG: type II toxin-antitoxin system RelE/ParE family toxin [Cyanophyceae cyanobacterium]